MIKLIGRPWPLARIFELRTGILRCIKLRCSTMLNAAVFLVWNGNMVFAALLLRGL